jgi:anhydro-N-acetylmuramic acid kinase
MVYRAIGLMSGSSLDGLDIVFAEFHENGGQWSYQIEAADCYAYPPEWVERLRKATELSALDYQLLHTEYGHYLGMEVNRFMAAHNLSYKVALIASHGHTSFHLPGRGMTAQLGDGAAIAAETGLPVVSDLRAMDLALGGQGAPIVPIGERLLWEGYDYFLNLGGIANISANLDPYIAFDICPANRVLNMLAAEKGLEYDAGGILAAGGQLRNDLLAKLNALDYYEKPWPKSLGNEWGTDVVYPLLQTSGYTIEDQLRCCVEHIAAQVSSSVAKLRKEAGIQSEQKLLVTGGGAFNDFLIARLDALLRMQQTEIVIPDKSLIQYKEALIMALIGILRWREEVNVLSSVTGSRRDSVGGAMWMGQ